MKWLLSSLLLVMVVACSGVKNVNLNINIPELDNTQYYDSSYIEGWKKLKNGKPKLALEYFKQSNLEDEKLYVAFGYTLLVQNRFKYAKKNFENALKLNPNSIKAEIGLATVYEILKDNEKAYQIYSHLRAKYPENAWIKVRYEYIKSIETENYLLKAEKYKLSNNDKGYIESLETAARFSSELVDIKIKIADFYYEKEDFEKSSDYYEEIQEKLPYREDILYRLADCYEKMEKYDTALVVYQKLSNLKPGDIDISNKINDLKIKFYEMNLPVKFKNIFFKYYINREDLAAFIGYYFDKYLSTESAPVIITDIAGSFAKDYIIKLCTLNIMQTRPDHSFERFIDITRASFAVVINSLIEYLKKAGYFIHITPVDLVIEPADISPLHKHYNIIKFLINAQIMKLDSENNFNPILKISPNEALLSIRKILNSIH